jgi:hypothetical protein
MLSQNLRPGGNVKKYNVPSSRNNSRLLLPYFIQILLFPIFAQATHTIDIKSTVRMEWRTEQLHSECKFVPLTVSRTEWLSFGSVFTWHSYFPSSLGCALMIRNVHTSDPGVCSTSNLESDV